MNPIDLQKKYFSEIDLSYDDGLNIFNEIYENELKSIDIPKSQHQILFASISKLKKINNILEIGTHDATNVLFLSTLFKNSKIVSLDLDDNDEIFKTTYERHDEEYRKNFIYQRDSILKKCKNVIYIKKSSIKHLLLTNEKFDLIWVDGAHGYPEVAIDISNSLRLLNKEGYLLCDDVFLKGSDKDPIYKSIASFSTLISFVKAGFIKKFNLVIKKFNNNKKFIAVVLEKNLVY